MEMENLLVSKEEEYMENGLMMNYSIFENNISILFICLTLDL